MLSRRFVVFSRQTKVLKTGKEMMEKHRKIMERMKAIHNNNYHKWLGNKLKSSRNK